MCYCPTVAPKPHLSMALIAFLSSFPPYLSAESGSSLLLTKQRNLKGSPNVQLIHWVGFSCAVFVPCCCSYIRVAATAWLGSSRSVKPLSHHGLTAGLERKQCHLLEKCLGFGEFCSVFRAEWGRRGHRGDKGGSHLS